MLLPGKETVAVRSYFPQQIRQIEKRYTKSNDALSNSKASKSETHSSKYLSQLNQNDVGLEPFSQKQEQKEKSKANEESSDTNNENTFVDYDDDGDELIFFRDSFKYPVTFFILPSEELQNDQLTRSDSFVMRAQRSLLSRRKNTPKV